MKPAPGVWGIDLGQCALKGIRLQEVDGQLTATAFDYVEYPKILSQPDADADQLTREALEQFLSRNSLKGDSVAIAVPGQSGLARFVKLPPVEEKKIADIVKFEAKQQIPFNLDEVVWDFQKLGASNVVDGFALETEIGLFAMKRDMVKRYLDHFKEVGVEVHIIQMAPLALCNFVAYDLLSQDVAAEGEGKKSCVVALDIGADSSNLVITDGSKVIWQRPIPLGGNHFTRALTKDMKLTFAKAEHVKRNATKSGAAELKKILASLKPVLNDFVSEVQRSLGYFTNTHRDAQIEYMVGLGNAFKLPGLQRFLAEKLQLEVRKLEKMTRLGGDSVLTAPIFNDNLLSFSVAYGLALQGLKRAKLITNLLPGEIRMERLVRAKKPWAVAASGLLLLGLGGGALGNYLDQRPYIATVTIAAMDKSKKAADRVDAMERDFQAAVKKAKDEEEAVKAIVAGQAEQRNWLRFTQQLTSWIPQPDASNLPEEMKRQYYDQKPAPRRGKLPVMSGKEANEYYEQRLREGYKPPDPSAKDVDPLPQGIDDLIQYHIVSVDARYCDDLNGFWKKATADKNVGDVRPNEHFKDKMPGDVIKENKGWVVEVAGFTFHHDTDAFIRKTLLSNLARFGAKKMPKKPDGPAPAGGPAPVPAPAKPADPKAGPAGTPPKVDFDSTREPVLGRISHVLLYKYQKKTTADTGGLEIISSSYLDSLVAGEGGGGEAGGMKPPGPGGGQPMSPTSPTGGKMGGMTPSAPGGGGNTETPKADRSGWKSLSSRGGSGGTGVGGAAGMGGAGGGGGAAGGASAASGLHERTEFVIVFIWDEPTPSDALRGAKSSAAAATGTTTPAGSGNVPGMPKR
jgi:type IV pilus assembly protein PilM